MLSNYLTSFSWKNLRLVIYLLWSYIPQVYFEWHFFVKWTGQFKVVFGNLVILPGDYHYNCPNIMGLECNGCCTWWFHLQDINAWSLVLLAVSSVFYLLMSRISEYFVFVLLFAYHQAVTVSQFYIYMPFSHSEIVAATSSFYEWHLRWQSPAKHSLCLRQFWLDHFLKQKDLLNSI